MVTGHNNSAFISTKDLVKKSAALKKRETAQYIADMVLELRNLTRGLDMKSLQGLLEVTFYEAATEANRVEIPPEEIEHLRILGQASVASA
jgi:hypothetical protein